MLVRHQRKAGARLQHARYGRRKAAVEPVAGQAMGGVFIGQPRFVELPLRLRLIL